MQIILKTLSLFLFLAFWLGSSHSFAYAVWLGLHCTPHNAAVKTDTWSKTAALVQGINANLAPCEPSPGTPCADETKCSSSDWNKVIQQFAAKNNAMVELPGSEVAKHGGMKAVIEAKFKDAAKCGFTIRAIMFYDNKNNDTMYTWTTAQVQDLRNVLDSSGHQDVDLMFDARNNQPAVRAWCSNPLVKGVVLEAGPDAWYANQGKRNELLKWLWTDPSAAGKKLIFQIVESHDPYGPVINFMAVRRLIRWFGTELMDRDFMQSSRVVFMPVTYNGPTVTFYPETTDNGTKYTNTMTSLALSLIEQRDLFELRSGRPTEADCDSLDRNANASSASPSGSQ